MKYLTIFIEPYARATVTLCERGSKRTNREIQICGTIGRRVQSFRQTVLNHFEQTTASEFERGDRTELIRVLGARGADMNATPEGRLKPLFWSANAGAFVGEMSAMIDYGADVNAFTSFSLQSILIYCSRTWRYDKFSQAPLARLLVRRGADVFYKDKNGLDAETDARLYMHLREDGSALADFLAAVKRAGSYQKYLKEPRIQLVRLRTLCARGRARPPADPVLERLFGGAPETPSTIKSTRSSRRRPLPNEVFWHVVAYWRTSRDDE